MHDVNARTDVLFTLADAHGSPHHTAEAPLLLATPDNITVSAGTRLSLVCVAWGNPAPNITWTPDATAVPYQNVYTTSTTLNGLTYVVSILEVCYTEPSSRAPTPAQPRMVLQPHRWEGTVHLSRCKVRTL